MTIIAQSSMIFSVTIALNEKEAFALSELSQYPVDGVVGALKNVTGPTVMGKSEEGLRSLLIRLKEDMPTQLARIDAARKTWAGK
jgi:hypothetical protein